MKSLRSLSNHDLLNRPAQRPALEKVLRGVNKLVEQEHDLTCEILLHIIEVENRGIHRGIGYSSMFVYCTEGLGYSESSAQRRICAAGSERGPELGENSLRRGGKKSVSVDNSTSEMELETVKAHQVNCVIDDEVMQLVTRCKELLSGKYPTGMDYNTLILELAKTWLEKHDPNIRAERRKQRKSQSKPKKETTGETSRYISPATRDKVYARDGGRYTFVGSNGKRCNTTWDLEIHHDETPYARGGNHSISNLRLLCAAHNKLEAERVFGPENQNKFRRKRE